MAGNWKMYKSVAQTLDFFEKFKPLVARADHCEIVIAPPFPALAAAAEAARGTRIRIAAQNLHWGSEGAYTGEVSGPMLAAAGCSHVIIGHSERRQYFGETDQTVNRRLSAALAAGLIPLLCIGETLPEREAGQTESVLIRQLEGALAALTPAEFSPILVAYEPVWAIGTGRTATPEMAADAHRVIRDRVGRLFGRAASEKLRILYGGSVKPDNIKGLMARPEIDGALVGGASLDPLAMAAIVNF
ncbi:MAG: triose-phosphate isomerase [Acidobacteria bacterium]|nr:triose-phosphate isomerase [Acidobacteriota bacterium]